MKQIYLDNNATTALDPRVLEVMRQEMERGPANPSSIHAFGREAKNRLRAAKETIAAYLGVRPSEIFFFSSGTEALNTLLRTLNSGHLITSDIEHAAIYKTAQVLEKRGVAATFLPAGRKGAIEIDALSEAIRKETKCIILGAANSETGVKNPIHEAARIASQTSIPFVVDAVALFGKEPFIIPEGALAVVFSAHKFHGPKGVGAAWIHPRLKWEPLLTGGGQELSKRAGTEDLLAILGCATAVELLHEALPAATLRMQALRDDLERQLAERFPNIQINGQGERVCNVSNLSFLGIDGEALLMQLDLHGVAASHGSACSAGALEPSRVLKNMGLSKEEAASAIRFSLSRNTTQEEIDQTVERIAMILGPIRGASSMVNSS